MTHDLLSHFCLEQPFELGSFHLLREHGARGDGHLVYRDLKRAVTAAALPDRARVRTTVEMTARSDVIAEVDDVLVLLHCHRTGGHAWASGSSRDRIAAVLDEISARIPHDRHEDRLDVTFIDQFGDRTVTLDARSWPSVEHLYTDRVRGSLDQLMSHVSVAGESRRLILWHGAPGTGKTTAITSLLLAWREWADGVIVTDPETLLGDSRYLRRAVLDVDDEDERWQLLVLEDAESLLHKGSGGKGMAKLLNLGDGLLGQGLRCLFLITTNEPLHAVHPALTRPGRCLSRIEFGPLPAAQAGRILARPVDRDMTLAEVMAASPMTAVQEPVAAGQYL